MKTNLIVCLAAALAVPAFAQKDAETRLQASADVVKEIMAAPDKSVPQDLLDKAQCVVVVPNLKKGAFLVGAKYGKGFFTCRQKGNLGWSAPGAIRVEGGSFGFQIGGSETDVIMLVMNQKGAERLLSSKFTVGGDASAAAGPVGRTADAQTDAAMRAEILTYSRARGVFAGISLQGATLREDGETNKELYGTEVKNKDIVLSNKAIPAAAKPLIAVLNKHSSRK